VEVSQRLHCLRAACSAKWGAAIFVLGVWAAGMLPTTHRSAVSPRGTLERCSFSCMVQLFLLHSTVTRVAIIT
jgi:hypothetical protein